MDLARVSFKGQRRKDGSTCSWCKLVGVRSPEAATLTHCGACWKKRRVKILYCGRRCQREAWPQHRVECAAGCWSPRQHPHHSAVVREYVARLTNDAMIYTLMWRREPNYAKRLYIGRVLPYLLSYDMNIPKRWVTDLRHYPRASRRYVSRLTHEVACFFLMSRRERRIANVLWKDHVLAFLLDGSTPCPPGWDDGKVA